MPDGTAAFAATAPEVPPGLTYCSDELPGIRRKRAGNREKCKFVSHERSMAEGWLTARERAWLAAIKLCG